jgi:sn-glycerol 3-phosphate transport system substrate-binding protein
MTKSTRWAVLIGILVGAFMLASCGGDDSTDGNGATADGTPADGTPSVTCAQGFLDQATSPVEITFWHSMTAANEETLERMVSEFNAFQDKVRVNSIFQGSYSETLDKYVTAVRGGDLPEIVQLEDTATQLVIDSGSAVPAQDCIDAEGYDTSDHLERVLAFYSVEGALWPMPFNVSNPVLYYNKTAFSEAGLDPEDPPRTFEDLREASQAIVDSGAATHGIAIELQAWYMEQWFGKAGEPYVNNGNGREARATEVLFNNELGLEIFTWLKEMVDEGLALNVGRNPSGADHLLAIGSSDAAMTIGTSAALGSVFQVLESGQFPDVEVGVAPMPGIEGDGGVLVGGASLWITNRSSSEKQEAARVFAQWLNEPEQQAAWHAGTGYLPIRMSATELPAVTDLWTERPQFKVAYDQLLEGTTNVASAGPVMGPYAEVREAVTTAIERMLLEGQSPEDALRQAEEESNRAMADYNERIGG